MKTSTKIITGAALLAGTLSSTSLNASANTTNQTAADTNVRTTQTVTAPVIKVAGDGVQATKKLASSATTTVSKATEPAQTAPVKATTHKVVPLNATATVSATALNDAVQSQVEKDPTVQAAKQTTNKIHSQLDAAKKTDNAAQQELAQQEAAYQTARDKQHQAEQDFAAAKAARDKGYDHKAQAQKDQQTAESQVTDALNKLPKQQAAVKDAEQALNKAQANAVTEANDPHTADNAKIADLEHAIANEQLMVADATANVNAAQKKLDDANAAKAKLVAANKALTDAQRAQANFESENHVTLDQAKTNYEGQKEITKAAATDVANLEQQLSTDKQPATRAALADTTGSATTGEDLATLQNRLQQAKDKLARETGKEKILEGIYDDAQALKDAVDQADAALKNTKAVADTATDAQAALDQANKALATITADLNKDQASLTQAQTTLDNLEGDSNAAVAEALVALDQAKDALAKTQADLTAAKQAGDAAAADEATADQEIAKAEADFRVAKQAIRDYQDKVAALSPEVAKAQLTATATAATVAKLSASLEQAQATLAQKRQVVLARLTAQPTPAPGKTTDNSTTLGTTTSSTSTDNPTTPDGSTPTQTPEACPTTPASPVDQSAGETNSPESHPINDHGAANTTVVPVAAAATAATSDGHAVDASAGNHAVTLPQTNEKTTGVLSLIGALVLAVAGIFGFNAKKRVTK